VKILCFNSLVLQISLLNYLEVDGSHSVVKFVEVGSVPNLGWHATLDYI
jgi:hypothetical protein